MLSDDLARRMASVVDAFFAITSLLGAVAQLMEFIDRSDSSFALIKRFPSLQKTQKIKWQHKQGLHSPTHSSSFLCDFVFAVEIASRLPALNFAVQFSDVM